MDDVEIKRSIYYTFILHNSWTKRIKTHNSVSLSFAAIVCYKCGSVCCGMIDGTETCLHVALILHGRTSSAETSAGPLRSLHEADTARRSGNVQTWACTFTLTTSDDAVPLPPQQKKKKISQSPVTIICSAVCNVRICISSTRCVHTFGMVHWAALTDQFVKWTYIVLSVSVCLSVRQQQTFYIWFRQTSVLKEWTGQLTLCGMMIQRAKEWSNRHESSD